MTEQTNAVGPKEQLRLASKSKHPHHGKTKNLKNRFRHL